jgi:hypothetical protein
MFTLPTLPNLILSTLVFFLAAWYLRRYLEEQGIPSGTTRGVLVFTLAYILSWGAGEVVDWVYPPLQAEGHELSKLLQGGESVQP